MDPGGERSPQVTGLETWFRLPEVKVETMKPPPRWKMWLVTVAAIYSLILALFSLLSPLIAEWPLPLRALIFPLVLVTLMTYIVMPALTRVLRRWLSSGPHNERPTARHTRHVSRWLTRPHPIRPWAEIP